MHAGGGMTPRRRSGHGRRATRSGWRGSPSTRSASPATRGSPASSRPWAPRSCASGSSTTSTWRACAATPSERLAGARPAARSSTTRPQRGIRFVVPGDAEWPSRPSTTSRRVEPLHGLTGPPIGVWARGPLPLAEATTATRSRSSGRAAPRRTAPTSPATSPRRSAAPGSPSCPVPRSASTRPPTAAPSRCGRPTVAVLACGVDRAYPTAHRELLDHIAAHRCSWSSEAAPGWMPTKVRFLSRNRLIAALTTGTVVVEAAVRSGALNTATWADRLQRVRHGGARAGDERAVGGGPRAAAQRRGDPGHLRGRTCSSRVTRGPPPPGASRGSSRARMTPSTSPAAAVLDAVPLVHPAAGRPRSRGPAASAWPPRAGRSAVARAAGAGRRRRRGATGCGHALRRRAGSAGSERPCARTPRCMVDRGAADDAAGRAGLPVRRCSPRATTSSGTSPSSAT